MVYLAFDQEDAKRVVIKQNRKRLGKNSKRILLNEARILSVLNHPSIPKCLNYFEEEQKYFLIMDYVEGKNYEDLILNEGQVYSEKESLQILIKVLNVVKYIHQNKLIHRDLRLPNIIEKDNHVFIIDFGLAVFCDAQETSPLKYNSLEKKLFREQSYRSDFYALGHFVLFLLYSNFTSTSNKDQSWEEELIVSDDTKEIIKKLLRIENCYDDIDEIFEDLELAIRKL